MKSAELIAAKKEPSTIGFYLFAIGTSVGLGNLWRFPYVVMEHGGGAFVLLYVFLCVMVGLPLVILEISYGRLVARQFEKYQDNIKDKNNFYLMGHGFKWLFLGGPALLSLFVLSYYLFLSTWALVFFLGFTVTPKLAGQSLVTQINQYPFVVFGIAVFHLLVVTNLISNTRFRSIFRTVSKVFVPAFMVFYALIVISSIEKESFSQALRYLLYPDYRQLTAKSLSYAIGQVLFTVSIGFGALFYLGTRLLQHERSPILGFRTVTIDTLVSLLSGVLIFPMVIQVGFKGASSEVVFRTIPLLFQEQYFRYWVPILFFVGLYLVATQSTVLLYENLKRHIQILQPKLSNFNSYLIICGATIGILFILLNLHNWVSFLDSGRQTLELFDDLLINILLPIICLVLAFWVLFYLNKDFIDKEFLIGKDPSGKVLKGHWMTALILFVPSLIFLGFYLRFFN